MACHRNKDITTSKYCVISLNINILMCAKAEI